MNSLPLSFFLSAFVLVGCGLQDIKIPNSKKEGSSTFSALPSISKKTLSASDFVYEGAFTVPQSACGQSTSYSWSGIARRKKDGVDSFFLTSHVYGGGLLYEVSAPSSVSKAFPFPTARLEKEYCDIYQGKKITPNGSTLSGETWTHGLRWDSEYDALFWNYGFWYNTLGNIPVMGYTKLDGKIEAHGPWTATPNGFAHAQKYRGGTFRIPKDFADNYTQGRTLAVGCGGYYSIIGAGSLGPAAAAIEELSDTKSEFESTTLVGFTNTEFAERDADYWNANTTWIKDPDPVTGQGYWTSADEINGACDWLELDDKNGLLFIASQGHGRIGYDQGIVTQERKESAWYIYSPSDLARVATKEVKPHEIRAKHVIPMQYPGDDQRVTGMTFDPDTKTLYVLAPYGTKGTVEYYPLVHVFKVN